MWKGRIIRELVALLTDEELGTWRWRVPFDPRERTYSVRVDVDTSKGLCSFQVMFSERDLNGLRVWQPFIQYQLESQIRDTRNAISGQVPSPSPA